MSQMQHFRSVIDKWKLAIENETEVHFVGDINLDSNIWNLPRNEWPDHDSELFPLVDILKSEILNTNVTKFELGNTWIQPNKKPKQLDHIYSTHPSKIINIKTDKTSLSDHLPIEYWRITKAKIARPQYITLRSFKEFDEHSFRKQVENDNNLVQACINTDTNITTNALQTTLIDA